MVLEKRSKKTWRSLGKERPWETQSRRPWRNRISSGSLQIRWNLNGGDLTASFCSSLGERKLGLGLEEEESGWVLRLMGSLRGEDLMESGGWGSCGVVGVEFMSMAWLDGSLALISDFCA